MEGLILLSLVHLFDASVGAKEDYRSRCLLVVYFCWSDQHWYGVIPKLKRVGGYGLTVGVMLACCGFPSYCSESNGES